MPCKLTFFPCQTTFRFFHAKCHRRSDTHFCIGITRCRLYLAFSFEATVPWFEQSQVCESVCVAWRPSPVETWDFCWAEVWRVRRSRLPLICSSTLWGSGARRTESSSPSAFHVRNWKRSENAPPAPPETAAAAIAGSDRKLALELRKVAAACWGSEQEKVTLPWRPE